MIAEVSAGAELSNVLSELLSDVRFFASNDAMTSILEVSEDRKRLRHLATPGLPESYCAIIDNGEIREGAGSCGTAAFRGTPVYVADIANDPLWADFREIALAHDLRACWSAPIKASTGQVLGTFAVYYNEPRFPSPGDMEMISALSASVSLAIEFSRSLRDRARIQEELRALRDTDYSNMRLS
jgi:GAF domain-containing protein